MGTSAASKTISLIFTPMPPSNIGAVKDKLESQIASILHEMGHGSLLSDQEICVEMQRTFPTDPSITVIVTLAGKIAYDLYKGAIHDELVKRLKMRFSGLKIKQGIEQDHDTSGGQS